MLQVEPVLLAFVIGKMILSLAEGMVTAPIFVLEVRDGSGEALSSAGLLVRRALNLSALQFRWRAVRRHPATQCRVTVGHVAAIIAGLHEKLLAEFPTCYNAALSGGVHLFRVVRRRCYVTTKRSLMGLALPSLLP